MALLTRCRESCLNVVRVRRAGEVFRVTAVAVCRRSLVFTALMTCGAVERGMRTRKGESRHLQVIESRSRP